MFQLDSHFRGNDTKFFMLKQKDIPGFFSNPDQLNMEDYILCDYLFETTLDPRLAAATLCCEQSTAQWKRPGMDEDLRERFGAKVVSLEVVSESHKPRYPLPWVRGDHFTLCRAQIAHPHINFGPHLPNLLSAIIGEGSLYCPGMSAIKLCDVHFPKSFLRCFDGPRFGLAGLREILKVKERPFFVGVIKPNIGLSPNDFAKVAYESWMGGLDIAKDDEMLANPPWSPLQVRIQLAAKARDQAEKETGLPKMMVANITDEPHFVEILYDQALQAGANAVMINDVFTGLGNLRSLRCQSSLPIVSHFTGMALFDRMSHFGIDSVVFVKLKRLAGCDMMIIPGFGNRMQNTDQTVAKNIKACLDFMGPIRPVLPIPGGGDWAGTLPTMCEKIGHTDFGLIAGRGVSNHPQGPRAGAQSLHEAWEAISKGLPLEDFAADHEALRQALETFSRAVDKRESDNRSIVGLETSTPVTEIHSRIRRYATNINDPKVRS